MARPTKRQLDVLGAIGPLGMTIDQVAEHLHMSRSTVEKHLAAIKARLGARTVPQAVYIATKRGLLGLALAMMVEASAELNTSVDVVRRSARIQRREQLEIARPGFPVMVG